MSLLALLPLDAADWLQLAVEMTFALLRPAQAAGTDVVAG